MRVLVSRNAYEICWDYSESEEKTQEAIFSSLLLWTHVASFLPSAEQNQQRPQLPRKAVMFCAIYK